MTKSKEQINLKQKMAERAAAEPMIQITSPLTGKPYPKLGTPQSPKDPKASKAAMAGILPGTEAVHVEANAAARELLRKKAENDRLLTHEERSRIAAAATRKSWERRRKNGKAAASFSQVEPKANGHVRVECSGASDDQLAVFTEAARKAGLVLWSFQRQKGGISAVFAGGKS